MSDDILFVYGSLRSEFDNHWARLLRADAEFVTKATVQGSIFLVGQYPGFRTDTDGLVHGELWKLRDAATTLAALDGYEGAEYQRVRSEATRGAWIYEYTGDLAGAHRIESGDFVAR